MTATMTPRQSKALAQAVERARAASTVEPVAEDDMPMTFSEWERTTAGAEALGLNVQPKSESRIDFSGGAWSAISHTFAAEMAGNPAVPTVTRILFAAIARMWPGAGVAYFHPGELREVLGSPTPEGDWKPIGDASLSKVLTRARESGLIGSRSTARKVYLNREHVQRGGKAPVEA